MAPREQEHKDSSTTHRMTRKLDTNQGGLMGTLAVTLQRASSPPLASTPNQKCSVLLSLLETTGPILSRD